jgi:ATP-dependent protease ClpP protease subunit
MKGLVLFIAVLLSPYMKAAEVRTSGDSSNEILWINGEIREGVNAEVKKQIRARGRLPDRVLISSPGGNVEEAIKLGQFFRDSFITVIPNGVCNSACALLVLSSPIYVNDESLIGLHRPYFMPDVYRDVSLNDAKSLHENLERKFRAYLRKMGVGEGIIEKALSKSSQDIWQITMQDFVELNGQPSHIQEWLKARCPPLTSEEESGVETLLAYDSFLHFVENCPEYLDSGRFNPDNGSCRLARFYHQGYREALKLGAEGRARIRERSEQAMTCQDDAIQSARVEFLKTTSFFE